MKSVILLTGRVVLEGFSAGQGDGIVAGLGRELERQGTAKNDVVARGRIE